MSQIAADCPRCKVRKSAFDLLAHKPIGEQSGWKVTYEVFAICRHCERSTVFVVTEVDYAASQFLAAHDLSDVGGSVHRFVQIDGHVTLKDFAALPAPEHLPTRIKDAFDEGARCLAVGCVNAGATMFRLCIDHATKALLPAEDVDGLNDRIRWSLGLRLKWLLDTKRLPESFRDLSTSIKDDGNDGAHEGTLSEADADDIADFTTVLLERLYTEPERLRLAKERRMTRRVPKVS